MAPKEKSLKHEGDGGGLRRHRSNERRETVGGVLGSGAVTGVKVGTVIIEGMGGANGNDATAQTSTLGKKPEMCAQRFRGGGGGAEGRGGICGSSDQVKVRQRNRRHDTWIPHNCGGR